MTESTQEDIAVQLGAAYAALDAAARVRHPAMLAAVRQPADVMVEAAPEGQGRWAVTICAWDAIGALSIIAGLFAAHRISIQSVNVFTVHPARPQTPAASLPRSRAGLRSNTPSQSGQPRTAPTAATWLPQAKLLDCFRVSAQQPLDSAFWEGFRDELGRLLGLLTQGNADAAREAVIDRVAHVVGMGIDAERQLYPVSVDLDNEVSPILTRLTIRSADTLGFLFAFTNALTMLEVNIERAEVRTEDGLVHDTFWLTDAAGRKITSAERLHELRVAAALIKQFTYLLPRSPNPAQALRQFNALARQMLANPDWTRELRDMEAAWVLETLAEMMGVSQFLWEDFLRMQHENLFPVLMDAPALEQHKTLSQLQASLAQAVQALPDHNARVRELNRFKDREMFRIDLRHITHRIGFREFSEELSDLAEAVVERACALAHENLRPRYGVPTLADGAPCPWSACALGKLGGRELGFGSDIELLFVYQGDGATTGPQVVPNANYFNEFVRAFLACLETRREGIFEIDLRLRPYGNKGAMASSLRAFTEYYSGEGFARQFERMALVRLRPLCGTAALGARVQAARDAFVYSGTPLDMADIHHLRSRQANELVPESQTSAKYSPGGLVDVEYYVQTRQIAAGRAEVSVRVPNTLDAIERLSQTGNLSQTQAGELGEAYSFLRRLIDALRAVRGHAKDLTIPPTDSREFAYLSQRLEYESPFALQAAISRHMGYCRNVWELVAPDQ